VPRLGGRSLGLVWPNTSVLIRGSSAKSSSRSSTSPTPAGSLSRHSGVPIFVRALSLPAPGKESERLSDPRLTILAEVFLRF
jgi:hypothetical protein